MKILDKLKRYIRSHSPFVWNSELIELEEAIAEINKAKRELAENVLVSIEATQEYELLMRNDMRLMFEAMNKINAPKEVKKPKNGTGNMYG